MSWIQRKGKASVCQKGGRDIAKFEGAEWKTNYTPHNQDNQRDHMLCSFLCIISLGAMLITEWLGHCRNGGTGVPCINAAINIHCTCMLRTRKCVVCGLLCWLPSPWSASCPLNSEVSNVKVCYYSCRKYHQILSVFKQYGNQVFHAHDMISLIFVFREKWTGNTNMKSCTGALSRVCF